MNLQDASVGDFSTLVTDLQNARTNLKNVNWNFYEKSAFSPGEMQPFKTNTHHWGPATFIPEIPFTLIEILTLPNAVVYDPFGGVGTTHFQALLLNRKPLSTEICRISADFMRALFYLFNPEVDIGSMKKRIISIINRYKPDVDYSVKVDDTQTAISKLKPWYSHKTLNELAFLSLEQINCQDEPTKAAMWISISAILQTTSSQDRGWGCIADNVLPKPEKIRDKKALTLFARHATRLLDDVAEHLECTMPGYNELYNELAERQTIFHRDIKETNEIPDNSVDLVVTSPPYPNMTDYVTSRRLSYYFVGQDMTADACLEIGARKRRKRKDALPRYYEDMHRANEIIAGKLKTHGYACYVMPGFDAGSENNENRRQIVLKLVSKMQEVGLIREEEFERIIPAVRRSHNAKWATLEREKIYLFRKV